VDGWMAQTLLQLFSWPREEKRVEE
jgi:hypothetical protein